MQRRRLELDKELVEQCQHFMPKINKRSQLIDNQKVAMAISEENVSPEHFKLDRFNDLYI